MFNYNRYLTDLSFDTYQVRKKSTSDDIIFVLPNDDRCYTVFSNEFSQETAKIINITVNIYSSLRVDITSPEEKTSGDINYLNTYLIIIVIAAIAVGFYFTKRFQ